MLHRFWTRLRGLSVAPALHFALCALTAACGGGDGGSGGQSATTTSQGGAGGAPATLGPAAEAFRAALQDGYCGAMQHCCPGGAFSTKACASTIGSDAAIFPDPSVAGAGDGFDQAAAATCVSAMTAVAGACDPDTKALAAAHEACQKVFAGTKQTGEPCAHVGECAVITLERRSCDADTGSCAHQPQNIISGVGEPCTVDTSMAPATYSCDAGQNLWCDKSTGTCKAPLGTGASCEGAATCTDGNACIGKNGPHKCYAAHTAGEGCWPPSCEISSDPVLCACGSGTMCDPFETLTCVPLIPPGGSCAGSNDWARCRGVCVGSVCRTAAQAKTWAQFCY